MENAIPIKKTSVKRKPVVLKMQYDILSALSTLEYTYIAKDSSGNTYAYINKPTKGVASWEGGHQFYNVDKLSDFCSWEDAEPVSISWMLNECEIINDYPWKEI